MTKQILFVLLSVLVFTSCKEGPAFVKNPVDKLIKEMYKEPKFSIILHDMDLTDRAYQHQYRIIKEREGVPFDSLTEWHKVTEKFFVTHQDNMGMEVASKGDDGQIQKSVSPPGYNNYVGNERYGRWEQRDGGSFWSFYGKFAFMNSMFNMMGSPARRSWYNDYRGGYYGSGRSYYGPRNNGSHPYGTGGNYNQSTSSNKRWNTTKSSSFKQRVSSRVKPSSQRTTRSSSRYKSTSSRSRGGGFGK
ncbi:MAG: hypothetical protein JEZ03_13225 [Bacteroidales bacterium]|nr:hypothetical protein [Bacteroidales bacterium]